MFHLRICVVCVFVLARFYNPPKQDRIWTSNPESGSQRTECSPFYVCCSCMFVSLYSTKSVPIQDKLHIVRLPNVPRFMCVFVFVFSYTPPKAFQFRTSYTESGSQRTRCSTFVCVVCVFVCMCSYTPTQVFQFRTSYTGSGSQQTKCSTLVCVLCVYLCVCVSIMHQKCSNSGQVTQNQAPNEQNVPPLYVCCVRICVCVLL